MNPHIRVFVETYLYPLQMQKRNGSVEIKNPGVRADVLVAAFLHVDKKILPPIKVADPTHYLNNLLYQVMKTGNPTLQIPSEIVFGFANCGRGFYSVFRRSLKGRLLSPNIQYPAHLVVEGAHGLQWTRAPEDSKEQLYHFLFHLRATMAYLAANPIGRKTNVSPSDIAQTLIQLPKRHALVRSGNHVGSIITDDTLPHMDEYTVLGNYSMIKVRTRQKYCRQVTASPPVNSSPPDEPPTVSRWEEV